MFQSVAGKSFACVCVGVYTGEKSMCYYSQMHSCKDMNKNACLFVSVEDVGCS